MRDVTAVESDCIITKQKAAMKKIQCDGYNNKFDVNNNKIWKWLWLFHLLSISYMKFAN